MSKITVTLNKNATIVSYQDQFNILGYQPQEVLGKNWFDVFINSSNTEEIMEVFNSLFTQQSNTNFEKYVNDVKTKRGNHILINFENKIFKDEKDETLLEFKGVEHLFASNCA